MDTQRHPATTNQGMRVTHTDTATCVWVDTVDMSLSVSLSEQELGWLIDQLQRARVACATA